MCILLTFQGLRFQILKLPITYNIFNIGSITHYSEIIGNILFFIIYNKLAKCTLFVFNYKCYRLRTISKYRSETEILKHQMRARICIKVMWSFFRVHRNLGKSKIDMLAVRQKDSVKNVI